MVSDTFGRPWRNGLTDVAIGVSGLAAVVDLRGTADALGRELQVTEVAIADEVGGGRRAGDGQGRRACRRRSCAGWIRRGSGRARRATSIRPAADDLFR